MLKAKLVVVGGESQHTEVELRLPTIIGRGRDVNLTVSHPLVSRRHAEIYERDGRLFVRDLGSLNGTFVNNQRIESDQPMDPEQLLTLGNVTFRAIYKIGNQADANEMDVLVDSPSISDEATDVNSDSDTEAVIDTGNDRSNADQSAASKSGFSNETVDVDSLHSSDSEGRESNTSQKPETSLSLTAENAKISRAECTSDGGFVDDRHSENLDGSGMGLLLKKVPR
jgi:pSer/pThr/pTyr-binding forkhead associated (FHA) protein